MSSYYEESYTGWHPDAVPRQQKKWLNFLSLRFGAIISTIAPIVCFAWAYTQHEAGVVATDGLGSAWAGISLGTVSLQETESLGRIFNRLTFYTTIGFLRLYLVYCGIPSCARLQLCYSSCGHHLLRLHFLARAAHHHLFQYARNRRLACGWLRIFQE